MRHWREQWTWLAARNLKGHWIALKGWFSGNKKMMEWRQRGMLGVYLFYFWCSISFSRITNSKKWGNFFWWFLSMILDFDYAIYRHSFQSLLSWSLRFNPIWVCAFFILAWLMVIFILIKDKFGLSIYTIVAIYSMETYKFWLWLCSVLNLGSLPYVLVLVCFLI